MIRVLHVITGLESGGAEGMLTRLVTSARHESLHHTVVSLLDEGFFGAQIRAQGVPLYCLRMRRGVPSLGGLLKLSGLIGKLKPDVVQTWLYHGDFAGLMALSLSRARAKLVWNIRCSDLDFRHHGLMLALTVRLLAWLSFWPDAVIVNSKAGQAAHAARGYRPRRWVYIPNGFDVEMSSSARSDRKVVRAELAAGDDMVLIGMVARLDPMKDHATFLAAAARIARDFPSVRFVLVGKGVEKDAPPLAPHLQAASLAGRVRLLGERADVARLMRGFDALVLSSAYGEGFPNVVGEAMAARLPCIVTDVGDTADIVGDTGLVVPARNADKLASAMRALCAMSPQERASRGIAARDRIAKLASLKHVLEAYERLYTELCA